MLTFDLVITTAEVSGALITALLLLYYRKVFNRSSLRLWTGSFAAAAAYLGLALTTQNLSLSGSERGAVHLGLSALSQVAAYWQFALAILATRSSLGRGAAHRRELLQVLGISAAFAVVLTLAWAGQSDAWMQRLFLRVGLRYVLGAICYAWIAVVLWRSLPRDGQGPRIAAAAMGLYSLQLLHVFFIYLWELRTGSTLAWSQFIGIVDLMAILFMGFGLIVWLLEEERNRALRADAALRRIRDFDPVTGLPNRRRLLNDLPRWMATTNQQITLLMLRLDQHETLSSTIGPLALESLMAEAATRFEQHARRNWHRPARLSDTRLVHVIPGIPGTAQISAIANDLLTSMRLPVYADGKELSLSASIGIALAPEDGGSAEVLIAAAESACSSAHEAGGNRFHFFSSDRNAMALTKLGLQSELRQAMQRGQLELYFQPIVSGDNHHICGVEGLVRWNHPERGTLLPEMFIEEVAQLGLSEELDRKILQQACREACLWRDRHGTEITLSVNVSTRSFQFEGFPDMIRSILRETGLEPNRLELEIVESSALIDPAQALSTLRRLREVGVRCALDDFGTGYSSLTHLRELPVDCLKIDRSFVDNVLNNPRDAAIVAAIINLAHSLGLEVVVEGIETRAQMEWFSQHAADRLQGFLFSAPVSREELHKLLASRDQWLARSDAGA